MTAALKAELSSVEYQLEDWFIERKFRLERAVAIKKILDKNNFVGVSQSGPHCLQTALWKDLVTGKPSIEPELSSDAKLRKADMYVSLFDDATDAEHPCRPSGMSYLRCLQTNFKSQKIPCDDQFALFDQCRNLTIKKQDENMLASVIAQDLSDRKAKELFAKRAFLIDQLK